MTTLQFTIAFAAGWLAGATSMLIWLAARGKP